MKSAIFTAFFAATTLCACGSDGTATGGRGPGGAIGSYQTPPANPQTALLSPQQPLPNATAPLPNDQAPLPNPEQPVSSGGSSTVSDSCSALCQGTGSCLSACQQRCGALGMILGQCASPVAAFIRCAQSARLDLVCNGNGDINVPDGRTCRAEARAAVDCLDLVVQPPDNSGPGNPPNARRRNDAGLPMP